MILAGTASRGSSAYGVGLRASPGTQSVLGAGLLPGPEGLFVDTVALHVLRRGASRFGAHNDTVTARCPVDVSPGSTYAWALLGESCADRGPSSTTTILAYL